MRKFLIFASCVTFSLGGLSVAFASGDQNVQALAWQPSAGHMQVPIWPDAVPDAQFSAKPGTEIMKIDPADFMAWR
ncbi:MAG: hypothetical protein QOJ54_2200 [Aliidongia sp.]|jgi:hypothetical protein|nr:hypothetical protein [Aliidongia sp.]